VTLVRTAGPGDALLLEAIHTAAFDGPWDTPWDAASLATLSAPPAGLALIAEEGGRPAGLFLARLAGEEAEILALGTQPQARRRGVARALLAEGLARLAAAGVGRVFLEVAAGNAAAAALYAAAGFVQVGRRKDYYDNRRARADALVMGKSLDT
jgi:ribosomal-protein-alanine N-acetyltransferase